MNSSSPLADILRNAFILAGFTLFAIGLTIFSWYFTKDNIQSAKEHALLQLISKLIPASQYQNNPYKDCIQVLDKELLGTIKPQSAWRLRDAHGKPVAVLISSVAKGYNGTIEILVGHYVDDKIANSLAGVRILSHRETPGLGDDIDKDKSDWILQFKGINPAQLSAQDWQLTKDGGTFDAFTGASITPRAVLNAIKNNIEYFNSHKQQLLLTAADCADD